MMATPTEEKDAKFISEIMEEVRRARFKHAPMHSPHEAYGVLFEELDEFFDEVKLWQPDVPRASKMRKELLQLAAMCVRAATDLGLTR
jgi:hypothetical protein